ncbi:MAG: EAL domain-containing protein [Pseudomonadota bacterium]|nr:EAL domain-containing protein [Pseudomonadota bacterium]
MPSAVSPSLAPARGTRVDGSLAATLQKALPTGSMVSVCWQEDDGALDRSDVGGVPDALAAQAEISLHAHSRDAGDERTVDVSWDTPDGGRAAIAASLPVPLSEPSRAAWLLLARHVVEAHIAAIRAQARAESLEKSRRLQHALYEIADLAGSDMEMSDLLRRIHGVVGGLMYAANFYIVLYDDTRESFRFLYFADQADPYVADPGLELGAHDMPDSLTLALLRHGAAVQGSLGEVREQLGLTSDGGQGPESADWLGVTMSREERVCGAVVVQSYDRPDCYGAEERALLGFVAQHILTALDRHQAREELERRVEERTQALQRSNEDLHAQILERQRGERLQRALFRIAELSITSPTLESFYAQVHEVVGELLYARNFYIALLSDDGERLEFPYSIDERDEVRATRRLGTGLTEYVIERGHAVLVARDGISRLELAGNVHTHGTLSHCWLGVPLFRDSAVVGVIAVQSYSASIVFTARDQDLLTFVAHHIGIGLARKQGQDRLVVANSELEQRVAARTRELALANAELLEQVGERLRAEQKLTHQARHDSLTGLPNRYQLLERLEESINRYSSGSPRSFAVLFLDLDRFKLVNDSVGHAAGDDLLVEAGRRLVGAMRPGDTVSRLGGDEFAILVDDIEGVHEAEELAQRALVALGQGCWIAGREVFPSASLGISLSHPRYRSGVELLRDADAAMYRAKATGRDRYAVFDDAMRVEAVQILDLESDLRRAINSNGFVAFYQPIVRLSDQVLIGHEALLRWPHEHRGMLSPGDFIGLGEGNGLIEEVDWLMYAQVARQLALGGEGYVSINVSPRHFRADDFAERLLRLLQGAGADPHRLRIEITEVALLDDVPRALNTLRTLRGHGVLAQLDDFGTGYSALSYLHRFPIECLKIDQSFVTGLVGDSRTESVAVVRAIQALAGTLGIYTIGEGIESEVQRSSLRDLGCAYGQGYLLGRPHAQMAVPGPAPSHL